MYIQLAVVHCTMVHVYTPIKNVIRKPALQYLRGVLADLG